MQFDFRDARVSFPVHAYTFESLMYCLTAVDDVFLDGMAAADPSSDWNAPTVYWGNYEEPPVLVKPAPPPKEQSVPCKVSLTPLKSWLHFKKSFSFSVSCVSVSVFVLAGIRGWQGRGGSFRWSSQIQEEEEKEEENGGGGCTWGSGMETKTQSCQMNMLQKCIRLFYLM